LKELEDNKAAIEARIRKRFDPTGYRAEQDQLKLEIRREDILKNLNTRLDDQTEALGLLGEAKQEQIQIDRLNEELQRRKVDTLNPKEEQQERERIRALLKLSAVQSELENIYNSNQGQVIKLANEYRASQIALQRNLITTEQYRQKLFEVGQAYLELQIKAGRADFGDVITASLGRAVQGFQGTLATLTDDFGQFFTSIEDGFANTVGQVLTGQETLKDGIHQLATEALSELIQGW
jgi:hypothetical protein